MLRYKSAWMPVAGTAEDRMQSYSGESQLERRELAAGTQAGAWGRARIESAGRREVLASHKTSHLTAYRAGPAGQSAIIIPQFCERSLYLSPRAYHWRRACVVRRDPARLPRAACELELV